MKNPHNIVRLVAVLVAVILFVVALVLFSSGNYMGGGICLLIGLVGVIVDIVAIDQSRKICNKCGAKMDGCAYEYEEISRSAPDNSGYVTSKLRIIAECPECGQKKKFTKKFKEHGSRTVGDLQDKVDAWCKDKFGH